MVPEGWEEQSLDTVFKLASGSTKPSDVNSERGSDTPHPVYGGNGVLGYSAQSNHPGNVILIGRVGEYCGVTRRVKEPCWITDNALYAKDFFPRNDIEFVTYRLQHFDVSRLRSKGGQPLVSQKPIYSTKFALPPLPEQRKIADILSTWDRAIETTEALLATARTQKRALMQSLLTGKRRFPEFEGRAWREVRLGHVARIIVSNVDKKTKDGETPVRLCNYTDVYKREFIHPDQEFMAATATPAQIKKFGLKAGDVVITKDSETADDIAMPTFVVGTADDLVCGYHLAIVRPGQDVDGQFLKFFFELPHTRYYFGTRANGAIRFGLTIDGIEGAKLDLPSIGEQKRIASVVAETEVEITALVSDIEKLRTEKKALMQQLLTGKRRVAV